MSTPATEVPPLDVPQDDQDGYDPNPAPKQTRKRRTTKKDPDEKTIAQRRDELFANGSEYLKTSRDEIVGIDNVLTKIELVIHWLKHSHEYQKYGSRLEPGIIFEGSPGTGKTLVSRWIATEADALFINVRDFAHEGTLYRDTDIRDLFRRARKAYKATKKPIILFWDEFENAALERSDAAPEQIAIVSQLTAELDGIEGKNEGVLLIGCTNYISSVDRALRRSGRMGLQIEFHAPDREGKRKILSHYLKGRACDGEIDTDTLSYFFDRRATAADIEEACVEAWRNAAYRSIEDEGGPPALANKDLVKVFIERLVGPPTTFTVPNDERVRIAIHEVGHAAVALAYETPLRLITVQPGKKSLGRTMIDDVKEYIGTIEESINFLRVGAGGMAAEEAAGIPRMLGSTGDVHNINSMAAALVDNLNQGEETGLFSVGAFGENSRRAGYSVISPQVSEEAIARSDRDVKALVDQIERDAMQTMAMVGEDNIWKLAYRLNERVTMTGAEFEELFVEVVGAHPVVFRHDED